MGEWPCFLSRNWVCETGILVVPMWSRSLLTKKRIFIGDQASSISNLTGDGLVISYSLLEDVFQRTIGWLNRFVSFKSLSGWNFGWRDRRANCFELTKFLELIFQSDSWATFAVCGDWIWLGQESVRECSSEGFAQKMRTLIRSPMREFGVTAIIFSAIHLQLVDI